MTTLREQIRQSIPADKVVVTCGREDDAAAWRALLDVRRCVAIALDTQMEGRPRELLTGASSYLTWQHDTIANIETDSWLARHVDRFDPDRKALLVIPDPFDPPQAGRRDRLGRRHPIARLLEDKTIVDTLWDSLGLKRARSIIADAGQDVATLGALVDGGTGVVCAIRPRASGPTSGGDGIWWWRGSQPPEHMSAPASARMRLMPLLEGLPVRLHGLVLGSRVITFPPMEIIALPRPDRGTFLPAGEVPSALPHRAELVACTERIGAKLRSAVGYRGAFAVDGVLTDAGFLPTDLNARLTSAMEPAPPELRVQLHAVNLLARDGIELDPVAVQRLVTQTFRGDGSHTLYGAARNLRRDAQTRPRVRWNGNRLVAAEAGSDHGVITVNASPRGWLVTARLLADQLPLDAPLSALAPQVFQFCDAHLGTDFGKLLPPFGIPAPIPRSARHRLRRRAARLPDRRGRDHLVQRRPARHRPDPAEAAPPLVSSTGRARPAMNNRPPRPARRRRMAAGGRHRLKVVLTTDEHAEIANAAHQAGVTQAGYCARAALDAARGTHNPTEHDELQTLAHLQVELFRIRAALNEIRNAITHTTANTSTTPSEAAQTSAQAALALADLDELTSRIHQRLNQRPHTNHDG